MKTDTKQFSHAAKDLARKLLRKLEKQEKCLPNFELNKLLDPAIWKSYPPTTRRQAGKFFKQIAIGKKLKNGMTIRYITTASDNHHHYALI